jgi:hypothetical protein
VKDRWLGLPLDLRERELKAAAFERQHNSCLPADSDDLICFRVWLIQLGGGQPPATERGCGSGGEAKHFTAADGKAIDWKGQLDHLEIADSNDAMKTPEGGAAASVRMQQVCPKANARAPLLL